MHKILKQVCFSKTYLYKGTVGVYIC